MIVYKPSLSLTQCSSDALLKYFPRRLIRARRDSCLVNDGWASSLKAAIKKKGVNYLGRRFVKSHNHLLCVRLKGGDSRGACTSFEYGLALQRLHF